MDGVRFDGLARALGALGARSNRRAGARGVAVLLASLTAGGLAAAPAEAGGKRRGKKGGNRTEAGGRCLKTRNCEAGLACRKGVCTPCTRASCPDGCCHRGRCRTGLSDTMCGRKGGACESCRDAETCSGGVCVAAGPSGPIPGQPCASNADCAGGFCAGAVCYLTCPTASCSTSYCEVTKLGRDTDGGDASGFFEDPRCATMSPDGSRVYVIDQEPRVQVFDAYTLDFVGVFGGRFDDSGNKVCGAGQDEIGCGAPSALLLSPAGDRLYVLDRGARRFIALNPDTLAYITEFDLSDNSVNFHDYSQYTADINPVTGDLYLLEILDQNDDERRVRKVTPAGVVSTVIAAGTAELEDAQSIAVTRDGAQLLTARPNRVDRWQLGASVTYTGVAFGKEDTGNPGQYVGSCNPSVGLRYPKEASMNFTGDGTLWLRSDGCGEGDYLIGYDVSDITAWKVRHTYSGADDYQDGRGSVAMRSDGLLFVPNGDESDAPWVRVLCSTARNGQGESYPPRPQRA